MYVYLITDKSYHNRSKEQGEMTFTDRCSRRDGSTSQSLFGLSILEFSYDIMNSERVHTYKRGSQPRTHEYAIDSFDSMIFIFLFGVMTYADIPIGLYRLSRLI